MYVARLPGYASVSNGPPCGTWTLSLTFSCYLGVNAPTGIFGPLLLPLGVIQLSAPVAFRHALTTA